MSSRITKDKKVGVPLKYTTSSEGTLKLTAVMMLQCEIIYFLFLSVNRFGELRDDNDPNCTYEGDNNMLLWQSSSYLLSLLEAKQKGKI